MVFIWYYTASHTVEREGCKETSALFCVQFIYYLFNAGSLIQQIKRACLLYSILFSMGFDVAERRGKKWRGGGKKKNNNTTNNKNTLPLL